MLVSSASFRVPLLCTQFTLSRSIQKVGESHPLVNAISAITKSFEMRAAFPLLQSVKDTL
jgi:hypothetical protein